MTATIQSLMAYILWLGIVLAIIWRWRDED